MKTPALPVEFHKLPDEALIRLPRLMETGLIPFSVSTLWRMVKRGTFPPPIKLSAGITAWRVADIRDWLDNPEGITHD